MTQEFESDARDCGKRFCIGGFGSDVVHQKSGVSARREQMAIVARPRKGIAPIALRADGAAVFFHEKSDQDFVDKENLKARKLRCAEQPIRVLVFQLARAKGTVHKEFAFGEES